MTAASVLLGLVAAALYGLAAVRFSRELNGHTGSEPIRRLAPLVGALIAHLLSIVFSGGADFAIAQALSMTTWLMTATIAGLAFRLPLASLGWVITPLAAVVAATMPFFTTAESTTVEPGVWAHAMLSLFAYGLLGLAATQACLIAWQTARLRDTTASGVNTLPPLATLERVMFLLISAGLTVLTAAIATGFVFLDNMFAQQVAHKTVFSLLSWFAFSGLLIGHHIIGWRGKTALRWTLTGMGLLLVGFFGSKLVLEVVLRSA